MASEKFFSSLVPLSLILCPGLLSAGHGRENTNPVPCLESFVAACVDAVEEDDFHLVHRHAEMPQQLQYRRVLADVQGSRTGDETGQGGKEVEFDFHGFITRLIHHIRLRGFLQTDSGKGETGWPRCGTHPQPALVRQAHDPELVEGLSPQGRGSLDGKWPEGHNPDC